MATSAKTSRTTARRAGSPRSIDTVVHELCLSFAETSVAMSHGSPHFRARKKGFAYYSVNHHGDGRIALVVRAPPGVQQQQVRDDPEHYFVPPYTGPAGWLGIHLNRGLSWDEIALHVRDAYVQVAPRTLVKVLPPVPTVDPPNAALPPEVLDPYVLPANRAALERVRTRCLSHAEVEQGAQFGEPSWRVGKRTFCSLSSHGGLSLFTWAGRERQVALTFDPRYRIPAYMGHNGWIALRLDTAADTREIDELIRISYEHFAPKRLLSLKGDRPNDSREKGKSRSTRAPKTKRLR